jgi:hypothetical protein
VLLGVISKPQQWGALGLIGLSRHGEKQFKLNPLKFAAWKFANGSTLTIKYIPNANIQ